MSIDVVGSKEKSQTSRGTMQDQTPSSTRAKSLPPIKDVGQPNIDVPGTNHQDTLGFIKGGPADRPHMNNEHPRTSSDGSPGGTVPSNNRPVTKPAAPGAFKRS